MGAFGYMVVPFRIIIPQNIYIFNKKQSLLLDNSEFFFIINNIHSIKELIVIAMSKKKLLFVFNPLSGKGRIKSHLLKIIDIFTKAGYVVTAYPTQQSGDCRDIIKDSCPDFELVVVSGGDGTLNEAVGGMLSLPADQRRPLGYIPAGTMNDFASTNSIPRTMPEAAQAIVSGRRISYDTGKLNDNDFIYVAAFGAFTDVSYDTPQNTKNVFGNMAYFIEAIKRLPSLEGINVHIKTVEGIELTGEVYICLIVNSVSVAGFHFGEFYDIDTNDGVFEIILIPKTESILDIASVIASIKNGERENDGVKVISTAAAEITTDIPVRWTLDGEFGGETDTAAFAVMHSAIDFVMSNGGK